MPIKLFFFLNIVFFIELVNDISGEFTLDAKQGGDLIAGHTSK